MGLSVLSSTHIPVSASVKGAIFERIVNELLKKNSYAPCPVERRQVDKRGRVRGRGEWHQIDAFGKLEFSIPFVYPIRLLCEAKNLKKSVGLPVVRNFVGVLKDISENYFVEDNQDIDKMMLSKRYTDCGAIFSASDFTKHAQNYAYAQGIFLISYENNPIIQRFVKAIEELERYVSKTRKKTFSKWFEIGWTDEEFSDPINFKIEELFKEKALLLKKRSVRCKNFSHRGGKRNLSVASSF